MPKVKSVIKEGNNVQEAIKRALKSLHITEEQAVIEVLSEGKKGVLGIGAKPARVKVDIKADVAAEFELTDILTDLQIKDEPSMSAEVSKEEAPTVGLVAIKDGKLVVTNPANEDKYAAITPTERVKVLLDGEEETEEVFVTEEDEIELKLVHEEPEVALDLKLSKDKVEAYLRYMNHPGAKYRLKEQSPRNRLTLVTEVEDIVELPPPTLEQIRAFLQEKKVVKGIIEEALTAVIENPNSLEGTLVAKGQRPKDGINAYIRYVYLEKKDQQEGAGIFEHDKLVSVNPGEVIAIKVPRELGADGWDVTGEVIPHKGAVDCDIRVKKGCEIVKKGEEAVSTISGRPILETVAGNAVLSVEPIYIVQEVSQATGNIKFAGDVEVKGDVRDGCRVEADGNVEVLGNVSRATIKAGSSVIVHKMILGSMIIAGGRSGLYSSLLPQLVEIKENLEKLFATVQQHKEIYSPLVNDDDGPLIQRLIDNHFSKLPGLVIQLSSRVLNAADNPSEEVLEKVDALYNGFCGLGPLRMGSYLRVHELSNSIAELIEYINESLKKASYVKARYVQNSSLLCSGDVLIDGQGCYISSMNAGGKVEISGTPGYARGVRIGAGGDIILKDVGSDFDTQTLIKTEEHGRITAESISSNVVIQVGKEKHRVLEGARSLTAYLNSEGHLTVDKLKEKS